MSFAVDRDPRDNAEKQPSPNHLNAGYFDLEQEADRLRLDFQWEQVSTSSNLVVLDEAQAWPEISDRLRGTIDSDRQRNGL